MRPVAAAVLAAALPVVAALLSVPVSADPGPGPTATGPAEAAVDHARRTLRAGPPGRDATIALRDLYLARPDLGAAARRQADRLLARPTDTGSDRTWDSRAPQASACGPHVCVHYVTTTADAPPMATAEGQQHPTWVLRTLEVTEHAWTRMVDGLGYPAPIPDEGRGGTRQFDVYLADVGASGLYGYCTPERSVRANKRLAAAYCVFDDDFADFPMLPDPSLRVTAAHELFHAVQFAMDAAEDGWFLEATATWIEEQVADDVDDNRQYLRSGQLGRRTVPLDRWVGDLGPYGNWVFFEALADRYGVGAVRRVWERAGARRGDRGEFSVRAVQRFVAARGERFERFYARFAEANLVPGRRYAEGSAWSPAPAELRRSLSRRHRASGPHRATVPHLSSRALQFRPRRSLRRGWRLRVEVRASEPHAASARVLVFRRSGAVRGRTVRLDRNGEGMRRVAFDRVRVLRVVVVVANASTRYACWRSDETFACRGNPRDDDQQLAVRVVAAR